MTRDSRIGSIDDSCVPVNFTARRPVAGVFWCAARRQREIRVVARGFWLKFSDFHPARCAHGASGAQRLREDGDTHARGARRSAGGSARSDRTVAFMQRAAGRIEPTAYKRGGVWPKRTHRARVGPCMAKRTHRVRAGPGMAIRTHRARVGPCMAKRTHRAHAARRDSAEQSQFAGAAMQHKCCLCQMLRARHAAHLGGSSPRIEHLGKRSCGFDVRQVRCRGGVHAQSASSICVSENRPFGCWCHQPAVSGVLSGADTVAIGPSLLRRGSRLISMNCTLF